MGKLEITLKFAEKLGVSTHDISWVKIKQSEELPATNIVFDALFAISAEMQPIAAGSESKPTDALDYFEEKADEHLELQPPGSAPGANENAAAKGIKAALEARKISITQRNYGGIIEAELPWPIAKANDAGTYSDEEVCCLSECKSQMLTCVTLKMLHWFQ